MISYTIAIGKTKLFKLLEYECDGDIYVANFVFVYDSGEAENSVPLM